MITLYTGAGCHLCEQARDILDAVVGPEAYTVVNISDDEALMAEYGIRIPVVKNARGEEKGWPFSIGQIKRLVAADPTIG